MTEGILGDGPPGAAGFSGGRAEPPRLEQLSLWEALALLLRSPGPTLRRILEIARDLPAGAEAVAGAAPADAHARPEVEAPVPAAPRSAAGARPLAQPFVVAYAIQAAFVVWLQVVLLAAAAPPATFYAQQMVLWLWLIVTALVVYGVWQGQAWATRAYPASEGFLTLLSLLATIQWAQTAGGPDFQVPLAILAAWLLCNGVLLGLVWRGRRQRNRAARAVEAGFAAVALLAMVGWAAFTGVSLGDYAGWAGVMAVLNLALGAALAYRAGRAHPGAEALAPPWIAGYRPYMLFLGAWGALLLAVAADSVLAGPSIGAHRGEALLYDGSPILCAGMVLWIVVAAVAWRLSDAGARRPRAPITALVERWTAGRAALAPEDADAGGVVQVVEAAESGEAPEAARMDAARQETAIVEGEARELPPAREIAPVAAHPLAEAPPGALAAETGPRRAAFFEALAGRRVPAHVLIAVSVTALLMAALVLLVVRPIRDAGIAGWVALAVLYITGSLLALVLGVGWPRVMTAQAALLLSFLAFEGAAGNLFTVPGVAAWLLSVVLWWAALRDPASQGAFFAAWGAWPRRVRRWRQNPTLTVRVSGTLLALVVITLVGAYFRFNDLDAVPPEMTSDHVEKLLDAARTVGDLGPTYAPEPQVFFPNNGGREPIQMYLIALLHRLTGLPYNLTLLKIVSALEAVITIPLMYWMGRELVGRRAGLIAAALVAVSYWHTVLGRMGLRIVLTPLFMALALIYLARAMRHNRRADFLKLGVVLGVGVYAYQALRMAPVFVVIGVGLAFLFVARNWRARGQYVVNMVALVLIALAVFVPMGRFMLESPELFWMRTSGRLVGEPDLPVEAPVNQFFENYNSAIWMYNWKSDVQWISNVPNQPELDPLTGALLALGLAAWIVRLAQRRDPVDLTLVCVAAVMLLPSALALAFPSENPSATRASGTLPVVYLWAAYALDRIVAMAQGAFRRGVATALAGATALALVLGAASYNYVLFFDAYREAYAWSAKPYSTFGAVVRGFADSIGSMETAFIVAFPHWLDHRAVGIEAGDINWVNNDKLLDVRDLNAHLPAAQDTALMVLYNRADVETAAYLHAMFPEGRSMRYLEAERDAAKDFYIFIVPGPESSPQALVPPPEQQPGDAQEQTPPPPEPPPPPPG